MPPVGQCQGRRNSADEGREGALSVGHLLGLQLPQEFGRTGLGRAKRAGELGGGEGAKAEQQHPCMIEARIRTLARKLARKDVGGAREAGDVAGGSIERVVQALAGLGATLAGVAVGPEQSALDQAGEGEGGLAQPEGMPTRGCRQVDRPARGSGGCRQGIGLVAARIAEALDDPKQPFERIAGQIGVTQRVEHDAEFGKAGSNDGFGLSGFAGHRPDCDLAHCPDGLGDHLLAGRQGVLEEGEEGVTLAHAFGADQRGPEGNRPVLTVLLPGTAEPVEGECGAHFCGIAGVGGQQAFGQSIDLADTEGDRAGVDRAAQFKAFALEAANWLTGQGIAVNTEFTKPTLWYPIRGIVNRRYFHNLTLW